MAELLSLSEQLRARAAANVAAEVWPVRTSDLLRAAADQLDAQAEIVAEAQALRECYLAGWPLHVPFGHLWAALDSVTHPEAPPADPCSTETER